MPGTEIVSEIKKIFPEFAASSVSAEYADELRIKVPPSQFKDTCLALHKKLCSPVKVLFALDDRAQANTFTVCAVFLNFKDGQWVSVTIDIPADDPRFDSLSREMHSASLFEREIHEMFGILPAGNPDLRRLHLHDEVWPQHNHPLRKDFKKHDDGVRSPYIFNKVEGEGIFEVPVGPVHAGIIGPGHFRFSVAGEPVVNLETRLGFTHRGIEKLLENKSLSAGLCLAERVSGDSSFAHSSALCMAAEKICGISVTPAASAMRGICLELERMYNHANDIGGIALDVGFSFPAAYASIMKEAILQLNEKLTASRYLKGVNAIGGVSSAIDGKKKELLLETVKKISADLDELEKMLYASVSFMDRVDTTGALRRKTAEDLGVSGLAGRASGIQIDLRKHFHGAHKEAGFKMAVEESGDCLARLKIRFAEFRESCHLINEFSARISGPVQVRFEPKEGNALGYCEGWRGPVLYWLKTNASGCIDRCKIVDPSFQNWQGLSYAVLGNIIPDFPLCNKSFDLSYSGNDL